MRAAAHRARQRNRLSRWKIYCDWWAGLFTPYCRHVTGRRYYLAEVFRPIGVAWMYESWRRFLVDFRRIHALEQHLLALEQHLLHGYHDCSFQGTSCGHDPDDRIPQKVEAFFGTSAITPAYSCTRTHRWVVCLRGDWGGVKGREEDHGGSNPPVP